MNGYDDKRQIIKHMLLADGNIVSVNGNACILKFAFGYVPGCLRIGSAGYVKAMKKYDIVKPIKLTAEWLEALGFKFNGDYYTHKQIACAVSAYNHPQWAFYSHFTLEDHTSLVVYVHELQNVIQAITGIQLTSEVVA